MIVSTLAVGENEVALEASSVDANIPVPLATTTKSPMSISIPGIA